MTTQAQKDFLVYHIIDQLTEYIIIDNHISVAEALKLLYQSKVYQQLIDEDTELYIQSPSYVYELLKQEIY
ncbi:MAG: hypothetical protein IJ280_06500 [Bacteroidales bacterium]|nr:hypothetical protein [Bacteroidales bacterium]